MIELIVFSMFYPFKNPEIIFLHVCIKHSILYKVCFKDIAFMTKNAKTHGIRTIFFIYEIQSISLPAKETYIIRTLNIGENSKIYIKIKLLCEPEKKRLLSS